MDIHFYVTDEHESMHEVGQGVMSVVPHIGEDIALELSLYGTNPHSYTSTMFFTVKSVGYRVWNMERIEEWMQPPLQPVSVDDVDLVVEPTNDVSRAYVARIIAAAREEE